MILKQILPIMTICFMALGGCGNSEPDYSEFYKDKEISEEQPDEEDDTGLDKNQIKVMSFNIRYLNTKDTGKNTWDFRKKVFSPMIDEQKPTVVGMQESVVTQLKWLGENWKDYAYIGKGRRANGKDSDEAVAIFYRKKSVELLKWDCFWLSTIPNIPGSVSWDSTMPRNATWAFFRHKASGQKFFMINTHIDVGSVEAPLKSMELIVQKIVELNPEGLPTLLTADFNAEITSKIFDGVKAFMTDVRAKAPVTDNKYTYTGFGTHTPHIADHIFCTEFNVLKYETIDKTYLDVPYISDHYPIVGTLEFKK